MKGTVGTGNMETRDGSAPFIQPCCSHGSEAVQSILSLLPSLEHLEGEAECLAIPLPDMVPCSVKVVHKDLLD